MTAGYAIQVPLYRHDGPLLDAEMESMANEANVIQLVNRSHRLHRTLSMEDIQVRKRRA